MKRLIFFSVIVFIFVCASSQAYWAPQKNLTWYWQLQGAVNNNENVNAYDIDGFENTASEVSLLHSQGKHVICYIDVGTWEEWRSDASEFPAAVIGKSNGWPGEKYLNIADATAFEPIMVKRFEMCKEKGFDAVEPDNMDTYEEGSKTGFSFTAANQLTYDEWIASEVHLLGMSVLQKNDGEQTNSLKSYFDGALSEECNVYSECNNFTPYISENKPVLNAEYGSSNKFCAADIAAGIMGARFDLELDGKTFEPCWQTSVEEVPITKEPPKEEEKPVEKPKEEPPKEEKKEPPKEEKHKKHHEEEHHGKKHEEEKHHKNHENR